MLKTHHTLRGPLSGKPSGFVKFSPSSRLRIEGSLLLSDRANSSAARRFGWLWIFGLYDPFRRTGSQRASNIEALEAVRAC